MLAVLMGPSSWVEEAEWFTGSGGCGWRKQEAGIYGVQLNYEKRVDESSNESDGLNPLVETS